MKNLNYLTSLILIFSLLLSVAVFVTADANSIKLGDVNGDGDITAADALEVLQYSVGKIDKFSAETSSNTGSQVSHFSSNSIDDFYTWLNKGGDEVQANQAFLSYAKSNGSILMPVLKNEKYKFYSIETGINTSELLVHWANETKDVETRELFGIYFRPIEDKSVGLEKLYYEFVTGNIPEEVEIKNGERNGVKYIYTDYAEDEKGAVISDSRAMFFVDDYLITVCAYWSNMKKPFNPEYLDYFDYETVELNIEK